MLSINNEKPVGVTKLKALYKQLIVTHSQTNPLQIAHLRASEIRVNSDMFAILLLFGYVWEDASAAKHCILSSISVLIVCLHD